MTRRRTYIACALLLGVAAGAGVFAAAVGLGWVGGHGLRVAAVRVHEARSPHLDTRVLVLGDSFLGPWPFPRALRWQLATFGREHDVGVVTVANPGVGPVEYLDRLPRRIPTYRPTHVLLFYHVGNDLTDTLHRANDHPQPEVPDPVAVDWDYDVFRRAGMDDDLVRRARLAGERTLVTDDEAVNPFLLATALATPDLYVQGLLLEGKAARGAWQENRRLLTSTFRFAREAGARMLVVAIPASVQVVPGHLAFLKRAGFSTRKEMTTTRKPQDLLAALCREQHVTFVDLLPTLRAHPQRDKLYLAHDDHFSDLGHQVAFQTLTPHLHAMASGKQPRAAQ